MKIANLILRIVAIALLVTSFTLLFISGTTIYKEAAWGVSSSGDRIDLDPEWEYGIDNYFGRMEILSDEGFGTGLEVFILIVLALAIGVLVSSFFIKFMRKIYFAAVPLVLVVLCIVFMTDADTWYVLEHEYLGMAYSYRVYEEDLVKFSFSIVPSFCCAIVAFLAHTVSGVFDLIICKKEKALAAADAEEIANEQNLANTVSEDAMGDESKSISDEIARYRKLCDDKLITEEEFDKKRKELLGL